MANVKSEVGPFELVQAESGSYRWENVQSLGGGKRFVYDVSLFKDGDVWRMTAGLYGEGFNNMYSKPDQLASVEQYGAPQGYAAKFSSGRKLAYAFMRNFRGSPGYNGLLDIAADARWVNKHSGPYY